MVPKIWTRMADRPWCKNNCVNSNEETCQNECECVRNGKSIFPIITIFLLNFKDFHDHIFLIFIINTFQF